MSALFLIRSFAYLALPLILAGFVITFDKSVNSRERRLEILLIYMFAFGAASGIAGAMGHFFASDLVAEAIGWAPGSPFQLEIGFANLSYGVLAAMAVNRRDGLREATVVGSAVFSVGAFIVHMIDLVESQNLAPGNTLINITNLGRPALLILFLAALRRLESSVDSEADSRAFGRWQGLRAGVGGTVGAGAGIGLGTGLAVGRPLIGLVLGLAAGLLLGWALHRGGGETDAVSAG